MTDRAFQIRRTRNDDIPDIRDIYAVEVTTGTATFEIEPPDVDEMRARYAALIAGGHIHLVAHLGERVLGYAYTSAYRPRPAYRYTVENSIYVARDARRLGVAEALLRTLIDECSGTPFRQMVAVIGDSANVPSIKLHEKLGFRTVGTLEKVGYKFDRWIDTVLMQRALKGALSGHP